MRKVQRFLGLHLPCTVSHHTYLGLYYFSPSRFMKAYLLAYALILFSNYGNSRLNLISNLSEITPKPSQIPSRGPSPLPTSHPTCKSCPSPFPSPNPSSFPTIRPTAPTPMPSHTDDVTLSPNFIFPTEEPTASPNWPSHPPTPNPSSLPTMHPTVQPTPLPTAIPTRVPTAKPTQMPTQPGTVLIQIIFGATQALSGCTLPTPNTETRYSQALKAAIAQSTDPFATHNVTAANVGNLKLIPSSSSAAAFPISFEFTFRRWLQGPSGVESSTATLSYEVAIISWGDWNYDFFSERLHESVRTGFFDDSLHHFAQIYNASGLLHVTSRQVDISLVSSTERAPSPQAKMSLSLVFGLAFGLGGGLCVLCTVFYLSSKGPRPWEDGYDEWLYKNEKKLRESGIGVTTPADRAHMFWRRNEAPEEAVTDDIPEFEEQHQSPSSASQEPGVGLGSVARRGTTLLPAPPPIVAIGEAVQAPWAIDDDRESGLGCRRL